MLTDLTLWLTWGILSYAMGYDLTQWQWWCLTAMIWAAYLRGSAATWAEIERIIEKNKNGE